MYTVVFRPLSHENREAAYLTSSAFYHFLQLNFFQCPPFFTRPPSTVLSTGRAVDEISQIQVSDHRHYLSRNFFLLIQEQTFLFSLFFKLYLTGFQLFVTVSSFCVKYRLFQVLTTTSTVFSKVLYSKYLSSHKSTGWIALKQFNFLREIVSCHGNLSCIFRHFVNSNLLPHDTELSFRYF